MLDGSAPLTIDHRRVPRQDDAGAEHRARADAHALDDDAARADERAVLDHDGRGLQRLEHAADADAAGQVHVGADLRARADRRPRVDHRAARRPTRRC